MPVSPDQFRSSLRAVPFGRTAYVVPPGLDAAEIVDVSLIVSLQPITPPSAGTRAA
jgi:hypothetical protein